MVQVWHCLRQVSPKTNQRAHGNITTRGKKPSKIETRKIRAMNAQLKPLHGEILCIFGPETLRDRKVYVHQQRPCVVPSRYNVILCRARHAASRGSCRSARGQTNICVAKLWSIEFQDEFWSCGVSRVEMGGTLSRNHPTNHPTNPAQFPEGEAAYCDVQTWSASNQSFFWLTAD